MTEAAKPAAVVAEIGTAVIVVGPSGAGKDSVMTFAARHFAGKDRIVFARRVITRPADAGSEAHIGVDENTFSRMKHEEAFCVCWEAHGLSYGVPREACDAVGQGSIVIINGSRQALPAFAATFPRVKIVTITAHAEVRAERLAKRGRESGAAITARLERQARSADVALDTVTIDNSGTLEIAGNAFVHLLNAALD
ncbi:phosphonate metabolism protein/1,5-bisphosphokinase (PRPP-forming) PhnN [Rhizobium sp. ARZ01]|uniref:phosphonate metabolism protein/1,5-bisphosphokinase (PRPP-forming) PhnN n=1 Tax=Rhizobium sp. ARZ01 TaxID=2769313 RepID=UPI0017857726|nr:phosphonate metabolism protein/1,5-bisphosphokinase (PRPP-forming) PhnN [Rhizobium sp. ARZ01]MBD9373762.1 phosphonate metabolism protein/1,5-bisphosphokinase (PRPP-forming) PhnN [Rhizobium sp. ARZ01]